MGETTAISTKKLYELAEEILSASGSLLKNESGPGMCDTQAIRRLLTVADELMELPRLQKAISEGQSILC